MAEFKTPVVFSDFDGTITERDVIITIMERFAPPEWKELKDKILYERTITLKDGVEMLFNLLESSKKSEIVAFIKENVKLREGFEDFLNFCEKENIKLNVLSGGLDFHIEPVLDRFKDRLKILCNKANFNSEKITIDYEYLPKDCSLCGDCGFCKIEAIEKYPKEQFTRILIGDSLTDLSPSKVADIIFARGDLIKYLEQEKRSFIPFSTFYDIQEHVDNLISKRKMLQ